MTKRALAGAVRRSIAAPRARAPSAAFSSRAGIHAVDLESDPTLAAPRGSGSSMSPLASLRMAQTEPSVFAEFSDLAEKYNAVNLGQGYPNFPIPDFVKEAGAAAIHADHNQYTRPAGHPQLVSQLAQVRRVEPTLARVSRVALLLRPPKPSLPHRGGARVAREEKREKRAPLPSRRSTHHRHPPPRARDARPPPPPPVSASPVSGPHRGSTTLRCSAASSTRSPRSASSGARRTPSSRR